MFPHKAVALAKKLLPWQKLLYTRFESYLSKYAPYYMFSMLSPSVIANKIFNGISYCIYRHPSYHAILQILHTQFSAL